ncbi:MAG TPA: CaiB/BaiF CoA-transferase family protein [Polyangiales bacterium]|nr:CaiB/BaiF CoA-transferase family protein [Polyangiales bacterium]
MQRVSPLSGLRVLDLSRVLAGPTATQMLGDLGADVVKVERPIRGDDTRGYGPPFLPAAEADERDVSAYFIAANRNKRSIAIDLASAEGARLVRRLAGQADVLVENFRSGDLDSKGLGYEALRVQNPRLIYCSISGFGRTGPRAREAGYDLIAQAMSGLMQLTGPIDGSPAKVGLGIADLICGYHAVIAILAALARREQSGRGQHIDVALYDTQLAALSTVAVDAFATGKDPARLGNGHPHIVPYGVFETRDGHMALTLGNDAQFERFAGLAQAPEWRSDPRFAHNAARVGHRAEVDAAVTEVLRRRTTAEWCELLAAAGLPCGPVRSVLSAFADADANERSMRVALPTSQLSAGSVDLVANPVRFSESPVSYRLPPPKLDEHAAEIKRDWLGDVDRSQYAAGRMC